MMNARDFWVILSIVVEIDPNARVDYGDQGIQLVGNFEALNQDLEKRKAIDKTDAVVINNSIIQLETL
jgi:hypothetical protein